MAMVFNNPDSMERFANDLRHFIDEMQSALNSLNGAYAALGEDWQDSKRVEFDENMLEISHSIGRFSDYANGEENESEAYKKCNTAYDFVFNSIGFEK